MSNPWFEPLITIVAIVAILGGLYAYTGNWPPLVVVESDSMQHGLSDVLGIINTGDLVLVQQVPAPNGITTYVQGESQTPQYSTYGEFGDVIVYYPNGDMATTPIIHRAIVWLDWDASAGGYQAPSLAPLDCGPQNAGANYDILVPGDASYQCVTPSDPSFLLNAGGTLQLWHVGWQSVSVNIALNGLGGHSGFVTMGDDNCDPVRPCTSATTETGAYDQGAGLSSLVEPGWVEGVARGMLPWFGAIKLYLDGNAMEVPPQSWYYLVASILVILAIPTLLPRVIHEVRNRRRRPPPTTPKKGAAPGVPKSPGEIVLPADDAANPAGSDPEA